jgi:bifunctional enzyme CysN/CysC
MNIVFVGHVDHGKSTIIGRLLHDTGSILEGKLRDIKERCRKNSKAFEYAFLLDALKDEQSQGITIDTARCHFRGDKRDYILIDAPGHIDFLKNMVSGAARADAAILVIDAHEGIQENSKRHGYLLSMLGIKQVIVCVNKMDLVKYSKRTFDAVKAEYSKFLSKINVNPIAFIPISAKNGENIANKLGLVKWHKGKTLLEEIDSLHGTKDLEKKPFRMPVQDIYKFTGEGDNRRSIAGRIEEGSISVGDDVMFYPSRKTSKIKSIETFNSPKLSSIGAGYSTSFTLTKEAYIQPGEIMCKANEKSAPECGHAFQANIFWMGKEPLTLNKEYKLKLGTGKGYAKIKSIKRVLDASSLKSNEKKLQVDRHEVAECEIETVTPIAFDVISDCEATGRFVLVDGYEIAGGGIITGAAKNGRPELKEKVRLRDIKWVKSGIKASKRLAKYAHKPQLILITGKRNENKIRIARKLEELLSNKGYPVYYIGIRSVIYGVDSDIRSAERYRDEHLRRFAEVLNILLDAGLTVIATASDLHEDELEKIKTIIEDRKMTLVLVGENYLVENVADIEVPKNKTSTEAARAIMELTSQVKK